MLFEQLGDYVGQGWPTFAAAAITICITLYFVTPSDGSSVWVPVFDGAVRLYALGAEDVLLSSPATAPARLAHLRDGRDLDLHHLVLRYSSDGSPVWGAVYEGAVRLYDLVTKDVLFEQLCDYVGRDRIPYMMAAISFCITLYFVTSSDGSSVWGTVFDGAVRLYDLVKADVLFVQLGDRAGQGWLVFVTAAISICIPLYFVTPSDGSSVRGRSSTARRASVPLARRTCTSSSSATASGRAGPPS